METLWKQTVSDTQRYKQNKTAEDVQCSFHDGIYTIYGSTENDVITVQPWARGTMVQIIVNGQVVDTVPRSQIEKLFIFGNAGNDKINVSAGLGLETCIHGGTGIDTINGQKENPIIYTKPPHGDYAHWAGHANCKTYKA